MADHDLFFSRTGMDRGRVQQTVDQALKGSDDGELYLEYSQSESFSYDDNRLKAATFDTSQGFGLRAVAGEATGYAHASEISEQAIARAANTVRAVAQGCSGVAAAA
ncbi:MAG TPA: DNA gyrase modulator, partial [Rhizomicrobium sp.]|nr:DNA gyrase modulator [Rhizomicrobium sp.]